MISGDATEGIPMPQGRTIDYGTLMHRAMRGLIHDVLAQVSEDGLPGKHHFFITFDTQHPDVELADWLSDRYPSEMTIVIQHWFQDLEAGEEGFSVTLNFGDSPEPLYIPYDAIKTFVDPSVEFGLRFETQGAAQPGGPEPEPPAPRDSPDDPRAKADVVSLDKFRK
jgi:hypothetical protein